MNMKKMMQQAQKMQKDMQKAQESLKDIVVEGTAGGKMVIVKALATKEILEVIINEEAVDPEDVEMLQDLILIATNEALAKAEEETTKIMGRFTNGMPGFF